MTLNCDFVVRGNNRAVYLHHLQPFGSVQAEESNRARNLRCKVTAHHGSAPVLANGLPSSQQQEAQRALVSRAGFLKG